MVVIAVGFTSGILSVLPHGHSPHPRAVHSSVGSPALGSVMHMHLASEGS